MDQAVNRRPLTVETQVISRPVLVRFVVYKMAVERDFFPSNTGFSLSVTSHQCSIFIHVSPTLYELNN